MLNDFLSGKRSYASKPGRLKKVDMEQRAEGLELKQEGKSRREAKRKARGK